MISLLLTVMPVPCAATSQVCPFTVISTFGRVPAYQMDGGRLRPSSAATGIVSK